MIFLPKKVRDKKSLNSILSISPITKISTMLLVVFCKSEIFSATVIRSIFFLHLKNLLSSSITL